MRRVRSAFTLLEVTLAMAISMLLLGSLYLILNIQMRQMQTGRDLAEQNALARTVLSRITNDIVANLGPVDPRVVSSAAIQEAAAGATGSSTTDSSSSDTAAATANSGTDKSTTNTASSSSTSSSETEETVSERSLFNLGIQGDETHLVLFTSKVPTELGKTTQLGALSDLRRVSWWLAGTADAPLGLARYEAKLATSADGLTRDVPVDAEPYVICKEATSVMFEYFDGVVWQPFWDGAVLQEDGKTPIGPPAAIAITITITSPHLRGPRRETTVRHVVALPTANGLSLGGLVP